MIIYSIILPNGSEIVVQNISPEYVRGWIEWGSILCRMANVRHLTILRE